MLLSGNPINKNKMKNNEELQKDVQNAIKYEPLLNAAEIGVIAKNGIITLTGIVDSYSKKLQAEDAAKKVSGVKAVIEKIEILFGGTGQRSDEEIAVEILNVLKWNWEVPDSLIKVKVEDGWVTLEGDLHWNYQRQSVKKVVSNVEGVKGVTNYIKIKPETNDEIEKKNIENALERNWAINDINIKVSVTGNKVTLNGKVESFYQKDEAERIAWNATGVSSVENNLYIEYADEMVY